MRKNGDEKEYFTGCYGIILGIEKQIKNTKLKVSDIHDNYFRDLTLHESQQEIERNCKYSIFKYQMRSTFTLLQKPLWIGGDVEVLVPTPYEGR